MEEAKHSIPMEVRFYIIGQAAAGLKQSEIVDMVLKNFNLTITQGAVSKIISKYKEDQMVDDKPRSGRLKKLSEAQEIRIVNAVEDDRTLTASSVFRDSHLNPNGQSHVSINTISRTLNTHGLLDSTSLIEEISEETMAKRLLFANECQRTQLDWAKVVFSDESDLFPDKQGKLHYRRHEGERVDLDMGPTYHWDPRKVKVWGFITYEGVGTLVRSEGHVNGELYLTFLQENLIEACPLLRGTKTRRGKYIFQQDNAKPHWTAEVKRYFNDNRITTLDWPSSSPDISPIENVWGFIKEELFKKIINSILLTRPGKKLRIFGIIR